MAAITLLDGDEIRNKYRASFPASNHTKPTLRATFQAIEDFVEANRASLGAAINTATAPVVLTNAEKKAAFAAWCEYKFRKDK